MFPDRVSNPGPLTYESGAVPIALCDPAYFDMNGNGYCHVPLLLNGVSPYRLEFAFLLMFQQNDWTFSTFICTS